MVGGYHVGISRQNRSWSQRLKDHYLSVKETVSKYLELEVSILLLIYHNTSDVFSNVFGGAEYPTLNTDSLYSSG